MLVRKARALVLAVMASLGVAMGAPALSTSAVAAPINAKSLEASVRRAILAEHSVHLVILEQGKASKGTERIVADVGRTVGNQVLTFGKSTAFVRVTSHAAYFKGNRSGLVTFFGLSSAVVDKIGHRWVSLAKRTSQYSGFKKEGTMASLAPSILPTALDTVRLSVAHRDHQKDFVLSWTASPSGSSVKIAERLTIPSRGSYLPNEQTGRALDKSASETIAFTRWGEVVRAEAPKSSIAYAKIAG